MSSDFFDRLVLQIAGPVVAALLGTLIIGLFVGWVTRRSQDRRARYELRHELVSQMTLSANELYFAILHYRRAKEERLGEGLTLAEVAPVVHEQYRKTRAMGHVLDSRLQAYFQTDKPRRCWHAAVDLLAVQYYTVLDQLSDDILRSNAGGKHSGLSMDQLRNHKLVIDTFRQTLRTATSAVLTEPLLPVRQMEAGPRRPRRHPQSVWPFSVRRAQAAVRSSVRRR